MLILIIFILLMIGSALTYNIYSIFKPFINNLGNIQNYNIAYRGAISSIERAELILRYHIAGFEGSGGRIGNTNKGPNSDKKINNFGLLNKGDNGMLREIKSRIAGNTIPSIGNGNIEYNLQRTGNDYGGPSKNFNKLGYNISEEVLLYYDNTTTSGYYYSGIERIENVTPNFISGIIRLPPKIYEKFSSEDLATTIDLDGDGIKKDIIVNRSIFGKNTTGDDFTILPTIDVDYSSNTVESNDTNIREDVINKSTSTTNNPINLCFGNNILCSSIGTGTNPTRTTGPTYHNIIPENFEFSGKNFSYIFQSGDKLHIKFSIVNLMKTNNEKIYPFLEYKLYLDGVSETSDRFFHITGIGKVNKYKVIIKITKPVVKTTAASDFTILF